MEPATNQVPVAELQSDIQNPHILETVQPTANTIHMEEIPSGDAVATNNNGSDPALAGVALTKFHKFVEMPLELRTKILEVNMFEDKSVSSPRILKVHMEWYPEEDECFGNHDGVFDQPWEENSDDEDDDDDRRHTHIYPDHENFVWKIEDDSQVRRSHRPLIPYFTVSKECKSIVEKFILCQMGRRRRAFLSPQLRRLPLSPRGDIFYIDCAAVWEAVNEWGSTSLCAPRDALMMRNFMVDFTTFHGLVEPDLRDKDRFLLYMSNKEPFDYFRGESSMRAVFKKAACVSVVPTADKEQITDCRNLVVWTEEDVENNDIPGLRTEHKEVLQSVWKEENSEFNELRDSDGYLPEVIWVTIKDKGVELDDQEGGEENVQDEGQDDGQENGQ